VSRLHSSLGPGGAGGPSPPKSPIRGHRFSRTWPSFVPLCASGWASRRETSA